MFGKPRPTLPGSCVYLTSVCAALTLCSDLLSFFFKQINHSDNYSSWSCHFLFKGVFVCLYECNKKATTQRDARREYILSFLP